MDIFDYLKQGAKPPGTADSSGYSKRFKQDSDPDQVIG
jgi:hypothetical protein